MIAKTAEDGTLKCSPVPLFAYLAQRPAAPVDGLRGQLQRPVVVHPIVRERPRPDHVGPVDRRWPPRRHAVDVSGPSGILYHGTLFYYYL